MNPPLRFSVSALDEGGRARAGVLHTAHGVVETPVFMPVGTQATVKGITPDWLARIGTTIVLANTYHLTLRPGEDVVASLGGLHSFMNWPGPILTDSGGFQVFSLAQNRRLTEDGVVFRSHIDGRQLFLSPERAVAIQEALGADIIMCLDHCPALPAEKPEVAEAAQRTVRWAKRCQDAQSRADQALFGIVQGGTHADLRAECAAELVALDFPGYAIGGVSVGERREEVAEALRITAPLLPQEKPRYLMGVGRPQDVVMAIAAGVDMFDCVLPTRNGRNATCLSSRGTVKLRNARYRLDPRPVDESCSCPTCTGYSRAYLRHLFLAREMLGPTLASVHNVAFLHDLMRRARSAIGAGRFESWAAETLELLDREAVE